MARTKHPRTVKEAVDALMGMLCGVDKAYVARMSKDSLIGLHHTLGQRIRNEFGLWQGNESLLRSCRRRHPDDASHVIIVALWKVLCGSQWAKRDWAMHKELL